ncbi:hypothetical protein B0I35DRAFT_407204 [Stachybotrys elegans]|uniref:Uncharacterized protein n=1 Tax=Stachybotrys elegans TaxID=80388 RepID=A0A8K0SVL1_9HYPO|nr:hypothetical protein B0I35DRAFT_407204 [Stachybotrys elegans]
MNEICGTSSRVKTGPASRLVTRHAFEQETWAWVSVVEAGASTGAESAEGAMFKHIARTRQAILDAEAHRTSAEQTLATNRAPHLRVADLSNDQRGELRHGNFSDGSRQKLAKRRARRWTRRIWQSADRDAGVHLPADGGTSEAWTDLSLNSRDLLLVNRVESREQRTWWMGKALGPTLANPNEESLLADGTLASSDMGGWPMVDSGGRRADVCMREEEL